MGGMKTMKSQVFMFSFAEIIIIFFVFRRRYLKQFCMSKTIQYFLTEVYFDIYIYIHAMHNANKWHQNEAGRSHRPVAVYLMKLQEYCFGNKIHFKYFLRLYSLEKEHKIAKNKFKRQILIYRPCFDATRFQVPSANEALCIVCIYRELESERERERESERVHRRHLPLPREKSRQLHFVIYNARALTNQITCYVHLYIIISFSN